MATSSPIDELKIQSYDLLILCENLKAEYTKVQQQIMELSKQIAKLSEETTS